MTNEMWANGKMDQARYTGVLGLNPMTLGCIGISMKRVKRANAAQKTETAPGQPLESGKEFDFIDEALIS